MVSFEAGRTPTIITLLAVEAKGGEESKGWNKGSKIQETRYSPMDEIV